MNKNLSCIVVLQVTTSSVEDKTALGVLENALAAAEDETDVAAARTATAEAAAELAEFDESIPLEGEGPEELSKAEQEVNALVQQVTIDEYLWVPCIVSVFIFPFNFFTKMFKML